MLGKRFVPAENRGREFRFENKSFKKLHTAENFLMGGPPLVSYPLLHTKNGLVLDSNQRTTASQKSGYPLRQVAERIFAKLKNFW